MSSNSTITDIDLSKIPSNYIAVIEDLFTASLMHINSEFPGISTFILGLSRVCDETLDSVMGVDDINNILYYNPKLLYYHLILGYDNQGVIQTPPEYNIAKQNLQFIILHELGHTLSAHSMRTMELFRLIDTEYIDNETATKLHYWRIACEYIANSFVVHFLGYYNYDNYYLPPVYISTYYNIDNDITTDYVYNTILKESKFNEDIVEICNITTTSKSDSIDVHIKTKQESYTINIPSESKIAANKELMNEKLSNIIDTIINSDSCGIIPAEMQRSLDMFAISRISISEEIMIRLKGTLTYNDYSWKKPNKRYIAKNIYIPRLANKEYKIMIVLDTSGSVSQKDLSQSWTEILEGMQFISHNTTFTIVSVDTAPHYTYNVRYDELLDNPSKFLYGGGGTNFDVLFMQAEEIMSEYDLMLFFTDGEVSFPPEPSYANDILWIIHCSNPHNQITPPFGDTMLALAT